jgi:transcriptional regulator with XRE-family HTH domain
MKGGDEIRSQLGENIRFFRTRRGLSQALLAEKGGISITFLSDIERGNKWPQPDNFFKLARALKVEPYELLRPEEAISDDAIALINKCLDDVSVTVQTSIEQSVTHSLEKIRKTYNK